MLERLLVTRKGSSVSDKAHSNLIERRAALLGLDPSHFGETHGGAGSSWKTGGGDSPQLRRRLSAATGPAPFSTAITQVGKVID